MNTKKEKNTHMGCNLRQYVPPTAEVLVVAPNRLNLLASFSSDAEVEDLVDMGEWE